jgi:hypothetical protein
MKTQKEHKSTALSQVLPLGHLFALQHVVLENHGPLQNVINVIPLQLLVVRLRKVFAEGITN